MFSQSLICYCAGEYLTDDEIPLLARFKALQREHCRRILQTDLGNTHNVIEWNSAVFKECVFFDCVFTNCFGIFCYKNEIDKNCFCVCVGVCVFGCVVVCVVLFVSLCLCV